MPETQLQTAPDGPPPLGIGDHEIHADSEPFVIAEIGVNHDGDIEQARRLIEAAKASGASAAKFQVFSADQLVTAEGKTAAYQARCGAASQRELLRDLELSHEDFAALAAHCRKVGIAFLATPFDPQDLQVVVDLNAPAVKVASPDLNNFPLLDAVAATGLPILLSTGASRMSEIDEVVAYLDERQARNRLVLLHCVSSYPTTIEDASLSTIALLAARYGLWVGYSDHTESIEAAGLAVACGARILEKHLTLDQNLAGPDHALSLTPDMFKRYVDSARFAWQMLGQPRREVGDSEREVRTLSRRSVVARQTIQRGQAITDSDLTLKRPAGGIEPRDIERLVGKRALRDIAADTQIAWGMVD